MRRETNADDLSSPSAFTLPDGAQNAFAADFHSRRRCAMS
jgi:hypothetical protein